MPHETVDSPRNVASAKAILPFGLVTHFPFPHTEHELVIDGEVLGHDIESSNTNVRPTLLQSLMVLRVIDGSDEISSSP